MAFKENKPITELGGLLSALYCEYGSRKTSAVVRRHGNDCSVEEHFDSGKGHSGAFWSEVSKLSLEVFDEAKCRGFISGKPQIGYTSDWEFIQTNDQSLLAEMHPIREVWEKKDWILRRAEYQLKDVPLPFRGILFEEACKEDGRVQLAFAKAWAERNSCETLLLAGLLTPPKEVLGDRSREAYLPQTDREREVVACSVATVIQWPGTKEGIAFFVQILESAGAKVQISLPE